jgi:hypothetical protein
MKPKPIPARRQRRLIAELDPTQAGINQFYTGPTSALAD